jgi:hypothetical protein
MYFQFGTLQPVGGGFNFLLFQVDPAGNILGEGHATIAGNIIGQSNATLTGAGTKDRLATLRKRRLHYGRWHLSSAR